VDSVFFFQATYEDLGIPSPASSKLQQFLNECTSELRGIQCLSATPWTTGSLRLNVTVRGDPATILNRKSDILKECLDLPSFPKICLVSGIIDGENNDNISDSNSNKDTFVIYIIIVLGVVVCLLCAVIGYYHHLYVQGVITAMDSIKVNVEEFVDIETIIAEEHKVDGENFGGEEVIEGSSQRHTSPRIKRRLPDQKRKEKIASELFANSDDEDDLEGRTQTPSGRYDAGHSFKRRHLGKEGTLTLAPDFSDPEPGSPSDIVGMSISRDRNFTPDGHDSSVSPPEDPGILRISKMSTPDGPRSNFSTLSTPDGLFKYHTPDGVSKMDTLPRVDTLS